METAVLKMLFIVSVTAQYGKHVYVPQHHSWRDAQEYCRDHYTDLSPIITPLDEVRLKNATIGIVDKFWIGIYRNETHWNWSGGGVATNIPWDVNEPYRVETGRVASACWHSCNWNGWHERDPSNQMPFFCLNLIVVELEMTWEQAMSYCKKEHTALTSLESETEHLLALNMIKHNIVTQRVWIGLRYLKDRWLWVSGHPLVYQAAWRGDRDHQCPIYERCGALTKEGLWENWDCQEKLNFMCF